MVAVLEIVEIDELCGIRIRPGLSTADLSPDGAGTVPGRLEVVSWTTNARRLRVASETANAVRLRTFHYPAWRARVDGRDVAPRPYGPLRVLEVPVPPGTHEVEVFFAATGDRRLGAGLSGIGLVTMAGLAAMAGRRRGPT